MLPKPAREPAPSRCYYHTVLQDRNALQDYDQVLISNFKGMVADGLLTRWRTVKNGRGGKRRIIRLKYSITVFLKKNLNYSISVLDDCIIFVLGA